jgi:predicted ester cyclase
MNGRNKVAARKIISIFSTGDLGAIESVVDVDYVDHQEPQAVEKGPELFRHVVSRVRGRFPDLTVQVEDLVSNEDKVAVRLSWHATSGGKPFVAEGFDIIRFVDGRAAEHWGMSKGWP